MITQIEERIHKFILLRERCEGEKKYAEYSIIIENLLDQKKQYLKQESEVIYVRFMELTK